MRTPDPSVAPYNNENVFPSVSTLCSDILLRFRTAYVGNAANNVVVYITVPGEVQQGHAAACCGMLRQGAGGYTKHTLRLLAERNEVYPLEKKKLSAINSLLSNAK